MMRIERAAAGGALSRAPRRCMESPTQTLSPRRASPRSLPRCSSSSTVPSSSPTTHPSTWRWFKTRSRAPGSTTVRAAVAAHSTRSGCSTPRSEPPPAVALREAPHSTGRARLWQSRHRLAYPRGGAERVRRPRAAECCAAGTTSRMKRRCVEGTGPHPPSRQPLSKRWAVSKTVIRASGSEVQILSPPLFGSRKPATHVGFRPPERLRVNDAHLHVVAVRRK